MRFACLLFSVICCVLVAPAFNPFSNGAVADICVCVRNDTGVSVGNAEVTLLFYTSPRDATIVRGVSDDDGRFAASRPCTGELRIVVRKKGHYETVVSPVAFMQYGAKDAAKYRRWSEKRVEIPIELKRKINPCRLTFRSVDFKPFPATNKVLKLDLEMLEWCPPYGNGRHADADLVFDAWRNPDNRADFYEHLKFSMPNCADGFYMLKTDADSAFRYAYEADRKRTYGKVTEFRHVHGETGIVESEKPGDDTYLVYRVRTKTNEVGEVVSANYGRIGEKFRQYIGLSIRSWFNPKKNDVNLEDARSR